MTENPFDVIGQRLHIEPAKVASYDSTENLPPTPEEIENKLHNETKEASERLKLKERIDPLGKVDHLIMAVNSDFHIPRAVPGNEPTVATMPVRLVERTADLFGRVLGRVKNWYTTDRQVRLFDTFTNQVEAVKGAIKQNTEALKNEDTKFLMVNLGDRGADGEVERDVDYLTRIVDQVREEVDDTLKSVGKVQERSSIWAQGDHEVDAKRHGPTRFMDEMDTFGAQDFVQRVGGENGYLIVSVSTSLRREFMKKRFEKMATDKGKVGEEGWKAFQEATKIQNDLIAQAAEIAKTENRKVILMGHQSKYLEEIIPEFPEVVMVMAGHEHRHRNDVPEKIKNSKGGDVRMVIPGTAIYGAFGAEIKVTPTMDLVDIEGSGGKMNVSEVPISTESPQEAL